MSNDYGLRYNLYNKLNVLYKFYIATEVQCTILLLQK